MGRIDVTVIVVSWNTCDILHNCLTAIYNETRDVTFEVIVVDNASTDGSAQMVMSEFPQVHLIMNSKNVGYAGANNQGIAKAHGRYVLLLNSDTFVLDNAIGKIVPFADNHPEAAVVGCRILNHDRTDQGSCFRFPSILNLLLQAMFLARLCPHNKFLGREMMGWFDWGTVWEVDVVVGCFMLVRHEAIEQVGVMDSTYFMYAEETDWCWRFKEHGWKILFSPDAEIIHLYGQSSRQVKPQMILQESSSILKFIQKNRSNLYYTIAVILIALSFGVRIPIWTVKGLLNIDTRNDDFIMARTCSLGFVKSLGGWRALVQKV